MKIFKILIAGFAMTGMVALSGVALGQDTPAATPADPSTAAPAATDQNAAANRPPEDNWLKICGDPLPDGKKACLMRQVVYQNGQFLGSFALRDDPGQESRLLAVAAVPIGVLLTAGMSWQIDGGPAARLPYFYCDPTSCQTLQVLNENYLSSLKKGNMLKLTAKTRQNKDIVITINLSGFTSVYDGDVSLTFDEFRSQTTGSGALEQVLQDKAEQIRRENSGETPPADGTTPVTPDAPK